MFPLVRCLRCSELAMYYKKKLQNCNTYLSSRPLPLPFSPSNPSPVFVLHCRNRGLAAPATAMPVTSVRSPRCARRPLVRTRMAPPALRTPPSPEARPAPCLRPRGPRLQSSAVAPLAAGGDASKEGLRQCLRLCHGGGLEPKRCLLVAPR